MRHSINRLAAAVEILDPSAFAAIMATGAVSLAAESQGHPFLARGLLAVNGVAALALVMALLARLALFPGRVWADLNAPLAAAGFFTVPAGLCILGSQAATLGGWRTIAFSLWLVGGTAWLATTYSFFVLAMLRSPKPNLGRQVDGGTCIAVVATQALAILAADSARSGPLLTFALCFTLLGGLLYILVEGAVFHRFVFVDLTVEQLRPSVWVVMGVEAITALAGATLMRHSEESQLIQHSMSFLVAFTLAFWMMASWWIPLLLALSVWRYWRRLADLTFDSGFWAMVFPLGVYSLATSALAQALPAPWAGQIATVAFWVALTAWAVTALGTTASFIHLLR